MSSLSSIPIKNAFYYVIHSLEKCVVVHFDGIFKMKRFPEDCRIDIQCKNNVHHQIKTNEIFVTIHGTDTKILKTITSNEYSKMFPASKFPPKYGSIRNDFYKDLGKTLDSNALIIVKKIDVINFLGKFHLYFGILIEDTIFGKHVKKLCNDEYTDDKYIYLVKLKETFKNSRYDLSEAFINRYDKPSNHPVKRLFSKL